MGVLLSRRVYSDINSFSVLLSPLYSSALCGSLVNVVSLSLNLWQSICRLWVYVGDAMVPSSVSVNRLVVILECDALVIVDAIPREKA
jgi:hypothetical protein